MTDDAMAVDAVAAAVHELRGSVGLIRMALTAVMDDSDEDAAFRSSMLASAEAETRRLAAAVSALTPLVAASLDASDAELLDVVAVLRDAANDARRHQIEVRVSDGSPVSAVGRPATLRAVLASMCGLVADGGGEVLASVHQDDGHAVVALSRADGVPVRAERAIVRHLIAAVGGEPTELDGGVAVALPK